MSDDKLSPEAKLLRDLLVSAALIPGERAMRSPDGTTELTQDETDLLKNYGNALLRELDKARGEREEP